MSSEDQAAKVFYQVEVTNREQQFLAQDGVSLLSAMERVGAKAIRVGCRGGGCGMCKIRVLKGVFHSKRMSRAHISEQEQQQGVVLACRIFPETDLQIESDLFSLPDTQDQKTD